MDDGEISNYMCELIGQFIESDDPCQLEKHFQSLAEDLRVKYASAFRNKFSNFFNISTWEPKYSESMFLLFSQLFTAESDIIRVLESLSKSTNTNFLQLFPKWASSALSEGNGPNLSRKIASLCEGWFSTIINAATTRKGRQDNLVITLYKQLSAISFVLQKRPDIHRKLTGLIEKYIVPLQSDLLLQSTSSVGTLEPSITKDFVKVLKPKLNPLVVATNDKLIKIINQICNSSGRPLDVPNR